jgi:hypothetical protein
MVRAKRSFFHHPTVALRSQNRFHNVIAVNQRDCRYDLAENPKDVRVTAKGGWTPSTSIF